MKTDNNLKEVKDKVTIFNLLTGAKENDSDVFVWRFIGSQKHLGRMRIESFRKTDGTLCLVPVEEDEKIVREIVGNLGHVDVYIPDCAMLFRCDLKTTDRDIRYYLKIPTLVAQLERRISVRLVTDKNSKFTVQFTTSSRRQNLPPMQFTKDCIDISSGGLSFYVSKQELKFFQISEEIKKVKISLEVKSIPLEMMVTTILEISPDEFNKLPYKVWRVNCKFTSIDQISKKYLEKFILEKINLDLHDIKEL